MEVPPTPSTRRTKRKLCESPVSTFYFSRFILFYLFCSASLTSLFFSFYFCPDFLLPVRVGFFWPKCAHPFHAIPCRAIKGPSTPSTIGTSKLQALALLGSHGMPRDRFDQPAQRRPSRDKEHSIKERRAALGVASLTSDATRVIEVVFRDLAGRGKAM